MRHIQERKHLQLIINLDSQQKEMILFLTQPLQQTDDA